MAFPPAPYTARGGVGSVEAEARMLHLLAKAAEEDADNETDATGDLGEEAVADGPERAGENNVIGEETVIGEEDVVGEEDVIGEETGDEEAPPPAA